MCWPCWGCALVELLYRLELEAVIGGEFRYFGLRLDSASPASWLGAAAVLLAGWGWGRWLGRSGRQQ